MFFPEIGELGFSLTSRRLSAPKRTTFLGNRPARRGRAGSLDLGEERKIRSSLLLRLGAGRGPPAATMRATHTKSANPIWKKSDSATVQDTWSAFAGMVCLRRPGLHSPAWSAFAVMVCIRRPGLPSPAWSAFAALVCLRRPGRRPCLPCRHGVRGTVVARVSTVALEPAEAGPL